MKTKMPMKTFLLVFALTQLVHAAAGSETDLGIEALTPQQVTELAAEVKLWKRSDAGKEAARSGFLPKPEASTDVELLRMNIGNDVTRDELERFYHSKKIVEELQKGHPHTQYSVATPFALMTPEEFSQWASRGVEEQSHLTDFGSYGIGRSQVENGAEPHTKLPKEVDWERAGCVTPIKNQGRCNSCWIFGALGALESAHCIFGDQAFKTQSKEGPGHHLISFSEQEVESCTSQANVCVGGYLTQAYDWIIGNNSGAVCTEPSFPYLDEHGNYTYCPDPDHPGYNYVCKTDFPRVACPVNGTSTSCDRVDLGLVSYVVGRYADHHDLERVVAQQPVTGTVYSRTLSQYYKGGVLLGEDAECPNGKVDHEIEIVGYGETDGVKYWRVKNSWGTEWGEQGYFRIERGYQGATYGTCGIEGLAYYPLFRSQVPWLQDLQCSNRTYAVRLVGKELTRVVVPDEEYCCDACRRHPRCQGVNVNSSDEWFPVDSPHSSHSSRSHSGSGSHNDSTWYEQDVTCILLSSVQGKEEVDNWMWSLVVTPKNATSAQH